MKHEELFSKERLKNFKDAKEHRDNFFFIQSLTVKIGVIEVITRNKIYRVLKEKNKLYFLQDKDKNEIIDYDNFVSQQTFGFWSNIINYAKIQNQILNLDRIDFRKYSPSNRKRKFTNYEKVSISYDLLKTIRNRAFHFENLYKIRNISQQNNIVMPRITTTRYKEIIGIMPKKIETFLNDILECLDDDLLEYCQNGGKKTKLPPLT